MTPDAPLQKPAHLRSVAARRGWVMSRPAAAAAAVLGLASFIIVAVVQPALWSTPDWRISVPGLAAAAIGAMVVLILILHVVM